jgi:hypothetical protein
VEQRIGALGELISVDVAALRAHLIELAHEPTSFSNIEFRAQVVIRNAQRRTREAA